ncbi:MAG: SBBP repeat-containing protein [Promethearchaeota archaeon]
MKNKKLLVLLIFVILNISFMFQNYNTVNPVREEYDKKEMKPILSSSNSIAYEWSVTWDGGINDEDMARAIALDSSGNIYLGGYTYDSVSGRDMCVVIFNSSGDYQWNFTWDRGINDDEEAYGIALDSSGNIYLAGYQYSIGNMWDMYLVKFNSSGDYQWSDIYDRSDSDYFKGIALDSSGNIYAAGHIYLGGHSTDMILVKYSNSGGRQWSKTWDRGFSRQDEAYDIALDSSGNIYLGGYSYDSVSGNDMCLVKFNSSGDYQWHRTWDGGDSDRANGIALDSSENIYLAGYTHNMVSGNDICLVKFNSSGDYQWNRTWDGGFNNVDEAYQIVLDSLDNIYLGGHTLNTVSLFDTCLVKFNSSGDYQWNRTWDGGFNYGDEAYGIALDSSENIYLAGYTNNPVSDYDMCLVKYNSAPKIKIDTPLHNEFYGIISPIFNISILESELDTAWYTLDGGTTNIIFSGSIGNISQTEWDKKSEGLVNINFHANDSIGLEGTSSVSVYKDTTAPTSSISFTPHSGTDIVNRSTTFILTADDGEGSGVASIMYKINDGDWTIYSNPFDLSDFKSGNHNISYYSIDKVGNIENINIQQLKIPSSNAIPGYNPFLVISLICIISVVTIKSRNKSLKK